MKFYPNAFNALSAAVTTALNPLGSASIDRAIVAREGGGVAAPTGTYTGQADGVFDVEIRNDTIAGVPRVSAPIFQGVGNPAMSGISASAGVAAQSFTITLADLGSDTTQAYVPFQGRTLRAVTAGADANYIQITVSDAGLTRTATNAALLSDLVAGTNEYVGREWDFGGPPRNPDGTIPAAAPRLSFGDDPQVYRQFKVYANGGYVYSFTPAPVRTVAKDAPVKAVTGGREVVVTHTLGAAAPAFAISTVYTLGQRVLPITPNGHWYEVTVAGTSAGSSPMWPTDGSTVVSNTVTFIDRGVHTNTYSSIITLFDALTAIQGDADSLIEVVEPIVNDLQFGGMGITDLSVQTGAFVQSITRDGSDNVRSASLSVTPASDAPTEEIAIKCISSGTPNAEMWEVRGTVSGLQASMVTGIAYDEGLFAATIPLLPVPEVAPSTEKSVKFVPQTQDAPKPIACVTGFVLGALAQPRTFNFRYEKRVGSCNCDDTTVIGSPNLECLGIEPPEGDMEDLPATLKVRAQTLFGYKSEFITAGTNLAVGSAGETIEIVTTVAGVDYTTIERAYGAVLRDNRIDITAVEGAVDLFYSSLRAMYDKWAPAVIPSAAYTLWDAALVAMKVDFDVIKGNAYGAQWWRDKGVTITDVGAGAEHSLRKDLALKVYTQEFAGYLKRYKASLELVRIAADIEPPFADSSSAGTGCWTDQNGTGWFVATDSDLLPIQVVPEAIYYHSARMGEDEFGEPVAVSARLFGIGLKIGCPELLTEGDALQIIIGQTGTSIIGYQMGDRFPLQVVAGSAVQLGGGQIGTDTLTWSAVSSVFGAMPDYLYDKTSPQNYTDGVTTFAISTAYLLGARVIPIGGNGHWYEVTIAGTSAGSSPTWPTNGGTVVSNTVTFQDLGPYVDFEILEGGIASRLGDQFVFYAEGGQFRWRLNGGGWTDGVQIDATVALSDGVSAAFTPGTAPSFVAGDTYQFTARAINGGEHLVSLTYGGITTSEFLETVDKHRIQVIPTVAKTASHALILFTDETEVGATVTLRGFATSGAAEGAAVFSVSALTNGSRCLLIPSAYTTACAKWTITYYATANTPATMGWLWAWIGNPLEIKTPPRNAWPTRAIDGKTELRWLLPTRSGRRADLAARVSFTAASQATVENLRYALEYASRNDDARLGVTVGESVAAPSLAVDAFGAALTAYTEAGVVSYEGESLEVTDILEHGSTDTSLRILGFTLELSAVP